MVVGADDFLQDVMIQTNGFGFLLCTLLYSAIAVISSGTLLKTHVYHSVVNEIRPIGDKNYPSNWIEFQDWFATEDSCTAYLERLRWSKGFCCPSCGAIDEPGLATRVD